MKLVQWSHSQFNEFSGQYTATIGAFDGIHFGHRQVLETLFSKDGPHLVIVFKENPKKILYPDKYEGDILSLKEKCEYFEKLGVKNLLILDFDRKELGMSTGDFLESLEKIVQIRHWVLGFNSRFGNQEKHGRQEFLELLGERASITEVKPLVISDKIISSTVIRQLIRSGDFSQARNFLGYPYRLNVLLVTGNDKMGLSYAIEDERILPTPGNYNVLLFPPGSQAVIRLSQSADGNFLEILDSKVSIQKLQNTLKYVEFIGYKGDNNAS